MVKKRPTFFPEKNQEKFLFFFLSALLSLLSFRVFLKFYSFAGEGHQDEFSLYFWGWFVFAPAGLLGCSLLEKARRQWKYLRELIYLPLLFTDFLLLLLFYLPLDERGGGGVFLFCFILFQVSGIALGVIAGRHQNRLTRLDEVLYLSMGFLLIFWLARVGAFEPIFKNSSFYGFGLLTVIGLVCFWICRNSPKFSLPVAIGGNSEGGFWKKWLFYGVAFLLIFFIVLDPRFEHNRHHASFFLGPLADLSAGKSILVDINAQYGILVFYFLSPFFHFLPLGFTSFTLVYTVLLMLEYLLFFVIARLLLRSEPLVFLSLFAFLLLNYFAPQGFETYFPSTGPLRFGPFYILTALILLRNRYHQKKEIFFFLESLAAGIAFFWSFEVCFYTVPAYLGLLFYESVELQTKPRFDRNQFKKRSGVLFVFVGLIGALLYLDVFRRSGHWPDWPLYLDLVFKYAGGFGKLPLPSSGYWWVMVAILLLSFFALIGGSLKSSGKEKTPENFNAVAYLIFGGITQFLYYLTRPASDNLCHICMAPLLLLVYWLTLLYRNPPVVPRTVKTFFFSLTLVFLGLYFQTLFPQAIHKMREKALPLSQAWKNFRLAINDMPRDDAFANNASELFEKYSGSKKFLFYFFGEKGLEVSLYTGRFKVYPYNDVTQAGFCDAVLARILHFDPQLKPGDYIYFSKDIFDNFEPQIYMGIQRSFILKLMESSNGIYVYRVEGVRT